MFIVPGRRAYWTDFIALIHCLLQMFYSSIQQRMRSVTTVICHIRTNFTLTIAFVLMNLLNPDHRARSDSTQHNSTSQLSWVVSDRRCEQSFTDLKRTTGRVLAGRAFRDNATKLKFYNDVIVIGMNFSPLFLIKCHTKLIFRIFHIWQINGLAPCCNLFIKRPSHSLTTVFFIYLILQNTIFLKYKKYTN